VCLCLREVRPELVLVLVLRSACSKVAVSEAGGLWLDTSR